MLPSGHTLIDGKHFYRTAFIAGRLVRRRLSVKRVHCDKTEERSVQIL